MRAKLTNLKLPLEDKADFKKMIKMENRRKKARNLRVRQECPIPRQQKFQKEQRKYEGDIIIQEKNSKTEINEAESSS